MILTLVSGGFRELDACTCVHENPDPRWYQAVSSFRTSPQLRGIDEAWL
jgi:hypothetical protein